MLLCGQSCTYLFLLCICCIHGTLQGVLESLSLLVPQHQTSACFKGIPPCPCTWSSYYLGSQSWNISASSLLITAPGSYPWGRTGAVRFNEIQLFLSILGRGIKFEYFKIDLLFSWLSLKREQRIYQTQCCQGCFTNNVIINSLIKSLTIYLWSL